MRSEIVAVLKKAVDNRKNFIIKRLIASGTYKVLDGRQLYELTLTELERLYINMMCQRARKVETSRIDE